MGEGRASFGGAAPSSAPSMLAAFAQKLLILLYYMPSNGACDMNSPPGSRRSAQRGTRRARHRKKHGKPPGVGDGAPPTLPRPVSPTSKNFLAHTHRARRQMVG